MSIVLAAPAARAGDGGPQKTATSTVALAAGMSPEDVELARYLDLLEHMDELEDFDCYELLPILEDDGGER